MASDETLSIDAADYFTDQMTGMINTEQQKRYGMQQVSASPMQTQI